MNHDEFNQFTRSFFVAFPSFRQWLKQSSPDAQGTLHVWRSTLEKYSLAECMAVVDKWTSGEMEPPEAFERDKVHLVVKSICDRWRSIEIRKKDRLAEVERRERKYQPLPSTPWSDANAASVFERGKKLHREMLRGEMSKQEYQSKLDTMLAELDGPSGVE
mgnify:CR=1 FL=1